MEIFLILELSLWSRRAARHSQPKLGELISDSYGTDAFEARANLTPDCTEVKLSHMNTLHRDPSPCARPPPPPLQTECAPRPAIRRQSTTEEILISRGFRRQSTTEEMIRCRNFRRQSSQSDDTCRWATRIPFPFPDRLTHSLLLRADIAVAETPAPR